MGTTSNLPDFELIERGIDDLARGEETVESVLASIGACRLEALGYRLAPSISSPEHRLYDLLASEEPLPVQRAHSPVGELRKRG